MSTLLEDVRKIERAIVQDPRAAWLAHPWGGAAPGGHMRQGPRERTYSLRAAPGGHMRQGPRERTYSLRAAPGGHMRQGPRERTYSLRAARAKGARGANVAVQRLDAVIKRWPGRAWAYAWRGEIARDQGRYPAAIADFETALRLEPRYGWVEALLGRTYFSLGKTKEADGAFQRACALEPQTAWIRAWHGEMLRKIGKPEESIHSLETAERLDPGDALGTAWRGAALRQAGRLPEALKTLNHAIARSPKLGWAYFERGKTRLQLKDWGGVDDLAAALQLSPRDLPLADTPRSVEIRKLERLLSHAARARQDAQALGWRGWTRRLLGRYGDALEDLNAALRAGFPQAAGELWKGEALLRMGRIKESETPLRRTARLSGSALAKTLLGECLLRSGRRAAAKAVLQDARQLDPKLARASLWLGTVYLNERDFPKAVRCFEQAIELDSKEPAAHARKAQALRGLGNPRAALESLQAAARCVPRESATPAALRRWFWGSDAASLAAFRSISSTKRRRSRNLQ